MYAIRKKDLLCFLCGSEDVCRIEDGSTNEYIAENRAIEDFLKYIEPLYNKSLTKIRERNIDKDTIFVIAGFASFVASCSPTAIRIFGPPMRDIVELEIKRLDKKGLLPPPPAELDGQTMSDLLNKDEIEIIIDPQFTQAMGITHLLNQTKFFGNSNWDILINREADSPFFTSDYPAAISFPRDARVMHRIVPLAPDIAVRIMPNPARGRDKCDFKFGHFRSRFLELRREQIREVNQSIVRCAESLVFSRHNQPWVERFVKRHAKYRIQLDTHKVPRGSRTLSLNQLTVRDT